MFFSQTQSIKLILQANYFNGAYSVFEKSSSISVCVYKYNYIHKYIVIYTCITHNLGEEHTVVAVSKAAGGGASVVV